MHAIPHAFIENNSRFETTAMAKLRLSWNTFLYIRLPCEYFFTHKGRSLLHVIDNNKEENRHPNSKAFHGSIDQRKGVMNEKKDKRNLRDTFR